eukprot:946825-Prorocentrum_minimum.AAC.4
MNPHSRSPSSYRTQCGRPPGCETVSTRHKKLSVNDHEDGCKSPLIQCVYVTSRESSSRDVCA